MTYNLQVVLEPTSPIIYPVKLTQVTTEYISPGPDKPERPERPDFTAFAP